MNSDMIDDYLDAGEQIILENNNVSIGGIGLLTNEIYLTTKSLIMVFPKLPIGKKYERYNFDDIAYAKVENFCDNQYMLVIIIDRKKYNVKFVNTTYFKDYKIWEIAILDRKLPYSELLDARYYEVLQNGNSEWVNYLTSQQVCNSNEYDEDETEDNINLSINFVKNMLKSGNWSEKGIKKAYKKAERKVNSDNEKKRYIRPDNYQDAVKEKLKEEFCYYDIKDIATEFGNEFRSALGMEEKKTHQELKEDRMEAELIENFVIARQGAIARKIAKEIAPDLLQELKDLYDAGLLTESEYKDKKDILLHKNTEE